MLKSKNSIYFWQRILTPHMSSLAVALAKRGFSVTFVANKLLSDHRAKMGWKVEDLGKVKFKLAKNKIEVIRIASRVTKETIHICQGLRGNGLVGTAQSVFRRRRIKYQVLVEMIDDQGIIGFIKGILYHILIFRWQNNISGILAIGQRSIGWFAERGMKKSKIYPFAYFLKEPNIKKIFKLKKSFNKRNNFKFIFVGRLIELKRVDDLLYSIASLNLNNIELIVVGDGPEKKNLKYLAEKILPGKVRWIETVPISKISNIISQCDCLVLPSRYDGWGAVVSEALMVGTPVICSDACGSSVVVKASRAGSIFSAKNIPSLIKSLKKQIQIGRYSQRKRFELIQWAKCLGSESGAEYLDLILNEKNKKLIHVPWK